MGTTYQSAEGRWHVQVKLHGPEDKIALFHAILKDIETDWTFHRSYYYRHAVDLLSVCPMCKGIVLSNTRITPSDIKSAASQAGIGCKIYNFAKENHCGTFQQRGPTQQVERKYAHVLYSHKPGRISLGWRAAWVGDNVPPEVVEQVEQEAQRTGISLVKAPVMVN